MPRSEEPEKPQQQKIGNDADTFVSQESTADKFRNEAQDTMRFNSNSGACPNQNDRSSAQNLEKNNTLPSLTIDDKSKTFDAGPENQGKSERATGGKKEMNTDVDSAHNPHKGEHVVKRGESLWSIVRKDGLQEGKNLSNKEIMNRIDQLVENNKEKNPSLESNPSLIRPGMKLDMDFSTKDGDKQDGKEKDNYSFHGGKKSDGNNTNNAVDSSTNREASPGDPVDRNKAIVEPSDSPDSNSPGRSSGEGHELAHRYRGSKSAVPEPHRTAIVKEALKLAGHSTSDAEVRYAKAIVSNESSFKPGAINLTDSNARKGTPSKGWAQTIDSTFNAYKVKGHGDIYNPLHNLAAAIKYADARYGKRDSGGNGLRWVAENRSMRNKGY